MHLLPIILVVKLVAWVAYPPIHIDRYETEEDCRKAAEELDMSTKLILKLTCEVDT